MIKKLRFISSFLAVLSLSAAIAFISVGCSPVKSIEKTFADIKDNYTLEIIENNLGGIKNYVRKHDGNKVYLDYDGEIEMVFVKNGSVTDVYTKTVSGSWSKEVKDSAEISYDMANNYAFNAFKLAKDSLEKHFYPDGDAYRLFDEYFTEVFGGKNKGVECVIERIDGKTTVRAVFAEGREDSLSVIDVGSTKVKLPNI